MAPCRGCFECWTRTPGVCVVDDGAVDLARRFIRSDLVVLLSPVTYGGWSSEVKKALDRSIGLISPFFERIDGRTRHRKRYARYPALAGVGFLPVPDAEEEALFRTLVDRNAATLHAPSHAATVTYWGEDVRTLRGRLERLLHESGAPS